MPNQYTKAEEEGRDKPKGSNQFTTGKREKHEEDTKDKMRAAKAAAKLEAIMEDPEASHADQIAASKELMRYGKVTADRRDERDENDISSLPEDDLKQQVRALITLHPWLLEEFKPGVRPAEGAQSSPNPVVDEQQTGT